MEKYIKYFNYIMEHKKNVFIECWKEKLYLHSFTHDLSKFSLKEFIPYARNFCEDKDCKRCDKYLNCDYNQIGLGSGKWAKQCHDYKYEEFEKACEHHYKNNKHHWNYWVGKQMPERYIIQMICDWKAMSRKLGGTAQEFYYKNYDRIQLEIESRCLLEFHLGLIDSVCLCSNVTWKNYCDRSNISMIIDLKKLGYIK